MDPSQISPEGVSSIIDALAKHGPATVVLILILAVIVWYMRYIVVPKEKADADNNKNLVDRQIRFIDSIESLVKLQTEKTVEIVKFIADLTELTNRLFTEQQKACLEIQLLKEKLNDLRRA